MIMPVAMMAIVVTGIGSTPVTPVTVASKLVLPHCICLYKADTNEMPRTPDAHARMLVTRAERAVLRHVSTNMIASELALAV